MMSNELPKYRVISIHDPESIYDNGNIMLFPYKDENNIHHAVYYAQQIFDSIFCPEKINDQISGKITIKTKYLNINELIEVFDEADFKDGEFFDLYYFISWLIFFGVDLDHILNRPILDKYTMTNHLKIISSAEIKMLGIE